MEVFYPVRTLRYELIQDSGGPGTFRGGLGVLREYTFPGHDVVFTVLADRRKFPPRGLFGGEDGRTARYTYIDPTGQAKALKSKATFTVPAGGVVRYETCGGGGYGDPLERDHELVLADLRERKISPEAARKYGVVVRPGSRDIDLAATERLRRKASAA
jgi:N-methylhydantoinase B